MDILARAKQKSELAQLLDFYGSLLPEATAEALALTAEEDLSLSEIAEQMGISRQGVHDRLQRGEEQLRHYEQQLGLIAKWEEQKQRLQELHRDLSQGRVSEADRLVQSWLSELE